jgi:hypothetical protein
MLGLQQLINRFASTPRLSLASVPWNCKNCCRTSFAKFIDGCEDTKLKAIFLDHARKCPNCKGSPVEIPAKL